MHKQDRAGGQRRRWISTTKRLPSTPLHLVIRNCWSTKARTTERVLDIRRAWGWGDYQVVVKLRHVRTASTPGPVLQLTRIAFGGAHRATMDDDDDPYGETEASSSSLAFAFDNRAENDDEVIVMGEPVPAPTAGTRKSGSTDTWHDGRPVLSGFEMDPLGVPADKWWVAVSKQ